jgi:hypothetical protein
MDVKRELEYNGFGEIRTMRFSEQGGEFWSFKTNTEFLQTAQTGHTFLDSMLVLTARLLFVLPSTCNSHIEDYESSPFNLQDVHKVSLQFQKCIRKSNKKTGKWKLLQNEVYIFKLFFFRLI